MTRRIAILCSCLLFALPAAAGSSDDDQDKGASKVRVVDTVEITGIDVKKFTLRVKGGPRNDRLTDPINGQRAGGFGGRGRRRNGGIGGIPFPAGNTNHVQEYKVFVTRATVLKDGEKTIAIEDFKARDRIAITGIPKGADVEATEISKVRSDPSRSTLPD